MGVGFHDATPCGHTDSGNVVNCRTFNDHFEYDPIGHAMRYQHRSLRNETLMMNHAGASGMCRVNIYAQEMREQNNVRICTRMSKNVRVDYAVPILPNKIDLSDVDWMEACRSTSPLHVP